MCVGHGEVDCHVCDATGQLKVFLRLSLKWETRNGDHVVEKSRLPKELVTGAQGNVLFQEEGLLVPPITNFCEESIAVGSQGLIMRHAEGWLDEMIVQQRHNIRSIPVSEANYAYKAELRSFWVYGLDQKAHCPDYPAKMLKGCTLL